MRARAWIGSLIGGVVGALVAGPIGAAVGLAAGGVVGHKTSGAPSSAATKAHVQAMHSTASPTELRALASKMPSGLAAPLKARAALREKPSAQNRASVRAMAMSQNPSEIEAMALNFKGAGAQTTAETLRDYARGLRAIEASGGADTTPTGGARRSA